MSSKLLRRIVNWLYPPCCAFCGTPCGSSFYCGCKLPLTREHDIGKALHELPFADGYASPLLYLGGARKAILDLKSRHRGENAAVLARMMAESFEKARFGRIDAVTCIPSAGRNYRRRGYNPAELIAKQLAAQLNLPFEKLMVCTAGATHQKSSNAAQRAAAVAGNFKTVAADLSGMNILLTDDVMTTGSTMNEAVKTLKRSGAAAVFCIAAATTAKRGKEG